MPQGIQIATSATSLPRRFWPLKGGHRSHIELDNLHRSALSRTVSPHIANDTSVTAFVSTTGR